MNVMLGVKRYRVLAMDFDSTPHFLSMAINPEWDEPVRVSWERNIATAREAFRRDFGESGFEVKLQNYIELGSAPFSIIAYHNAFFRQIRYSFVIGSYYPALMGACALGERILNHLVLELRNEFKTSAAYKRVWRRQAIADWGMAVQVLDSWGVLQPKSVTALLALERVRNDSIHFRPGLDARSVGLKAIHPLAAAIEAQFASIGPQPWFIPDAPGAAFIKEGWELDPFIRAVYLPNCALVGPEHHLEDFDGRGWAATDTGDYGAEALSDEEFLARYIAHCARIAPGGTA